METESTVIPIKFATELKVSKTKDLVAYLANSKLETNGRITQVKWILRIIIGLVALIHCYILWFEMFAWTTRGPKVFTKFPPELFEQTTALAANQGLYNGFLAAGLIWTFFITNKKWSNNVAIFFLSCVAVAGFYGALTAETKIFFVQALPALIGLVLAIATRRESSNHQNS